MARPLGRYRRSCDRETPKKPNRRHFGLFSHGRGTGMTLNARVDGSGAKRGHNAPPCCLGHSAHVESRRWRPDGFEGDSSFFFFSLPLSLSTFCRLAG